MAVRLLPCRCKRCFSVRVSEQEVIEMNRRFGGDVSLNAPVRDEGTLANGRIGSSIKAQVRNHT
jgi:hypothetical protein